ncbi:MAG: nuclear transport factor 2 family protein [Hydrogenophilaceae bacterium]|jgi:hypothetical protein|nr:nuclear transport factor 2 family protein [Hydrogenophilaceae bacterium]
MERIVYERYAAAFAARDYDAVLSYWAPKFSATMQGETLFSTPEELRRFYAYLHGFVDESIEVTRYLSDESAIFMEANVRIAARRTMTREDIDKLGVASMLPIEQGAVLKIPQFVHYHLRDGKFVAVACLISGPPVPG